MRSAAPPHIHRLARLHRWAMLWLTWFLAFVEHIETFAPLSEQVARIAHHWLDSVERIVVDIAVCRGAAGVRQGLRRRTMHAHPRRDAGFVRALLGSRLRRALRSSNLRTRIATLRLGADALAARLLKRLPSGLTRRRPILARPETRAATPPHASLPAPALADSS